MYKILRLIAVCSVISAVTAHRGRKFLLAFPPHYNLHTDGYCHIIINTNLQAQVSISSNDYSDDISVDPGSYIYSTDCTIRAQPGHSYKAMVVTSDVDVSVQVYSDRSSLGDAYLSLPSTNVGADYIIATPPEPCADGNINSVFTIAAEVDGTRIEIYAPAPGGYTLVHMIYMNRFATYTNTSTSADVDFTGWKIRSDAPVSLITGSSCYRINVGACTASNSGYIFAPPTYQAGYKFIIPKIMKESPGDSGAFIRVISYSQSNLIQLPDQSINELLNAGEFYQHHIETWDQLTRVECMEQCIVILYNEVACDTGEAGFMMYVTPLERGVLYSQFTAMDESWPNRILDNYITVIAESPTVRLDGVLITGWKEIPNWDYHEVSLAIDHGEHALQTADGGKFVAFVYGHRPGYSSGYGSAIVHADVDPITTTIAPTTDLPGEYPYRISLVSDWISTEAMETHCVTQYTNQIRQTTLQMAVLINDGIDENIMCDGVTTQDIRIASSSSSFFANSKSGYAQTIFIVTTEPNISFSDAFNCIQEVIDYAKPHSNWGEPLLDEIINCAFPDFIDGVFYDGSHEWICINYDEFEEYIPVPSYYIGLEDVGTTHDQTELSPECASKYSFSLDVQGAAMFSQLNTLIGDQLCSGISGIGVATYLTSFTAQDTDALIHIDFILSLDDNLNGGDVLVCADDILQYVKGYSNWDLPLLPPEDGCPEVEFDGDEYNNTYNGWICRD